MKKTTKKKFRRKTMAEHTDEEVRARYERAIKRSGLRLVRSDEEAHRGAKSAIEHARAHPERLVGAIEKRLRRPRRDEPEAV